ncbi:MAG: phosphate starvation-inducible protein PhoH [Ruminococcaceae bacterium]|nr:phosphate starvation-inducible protein PhoH [Oscillospiraceae bacterium]
MAEKVLLTDTFEQTSVIFGNFDVNIQMIENAFGVKITNRDTEKTAGNAVVVSGEQENVENAYTALAYLKKLSVLDDSVSEQNVDYVISMVKDGREDELQDFGDDCICITSRGKPIKAKTVGQKHYVEAIKNNMVVMGIGPAGTGKTFLAVAMAVTALRNKQVSRIILTRPAVEAGEKLGYLPGDLQNKIDPYLRPLYDAMYEMMGGENYLRNLEKGVIEIAPLAYMRGRTLDDSFIILDEAQNTTPEQMKMFLTRLGFNTKAVVTGDITQTDLPFGKKSGLVEAMKILKDVEGIHIHNFTSRDVVRHKLVQRIINAYEKYEKDNMDKAKNTRVIKRTVN